MAIFWAAAGFDDLGGAGNGFGAVWSMNVNVNGDGRIGFKPIIFLDLWITGAYIAFFRIDMRARVGTGARGRAESSLLCGERG
ncbi:MAG: hypothetical protein KJ749_11105 [Planctomycetes bacterium]|nr:hypothetical protein [Planctomycetota bacterium]